MAGNLPSYAYDGDGTRTSKTVGSTATPYVWDRQAGLPLLASDGTNGYLSDTQGSLLGQLDASNTPTYYLDDSLGSVRGTSGTAGTLAGSADYDVFGTARVTSGTQPGAGLGFTGNQADAETSFEYLRARDYIPSLGRFVSADSVAPNAPGTQGYNLYTYVANNPTTWADPSGQSLPVQALLLGPEVVAIACLITPWCRDLVLISEAVVAAGVAAEGNSPNAVARGNILLEADFEFILTACALNVTTRPDANHCFHVGGPVPSLGQGSTGPCSPVPAAPATPTVGLASPSATGCGIGSASQPPPPNPQPCAGFRAGPYVPPPGQSDRPPSNRRGGAGFTDDQRQEIEAQNVTAWNTGQNHSDKSGTVLNKGPRKGNPNQLQIDHICPISKGGDNSYSNACVLSARENASKGNRGPYTCGRTRSQPHSSQRVRAQQPICLEWVPRGNRLPGRNPMSLSSRRFPTHHTIWRGAVLGSVAEALWVADHPASFGQRWEDSTYLLDDEQGLRGGVAFAGNRLVAAFFCADSDRNPMPDEWEALYDIRPFIRGMPQDLLHLAEVRLLPEMEIEYRGKETPIITAAFWGEGEHLTAAEPWEAVFENGAVLLEVQLMELEAAISAWQINYAFSSSQVAVLRSLFERRMASQALPVTVEPWERAILIEDGALGIEKSRALLAAVGIVLL